MSQCCGNCGRGWDAPNGNVSCGAAVDDAALGRMSLGNNPTWAWRKYGPFAIFALAAGKVPDPTGTDCENMARDDGKLCAAWAAKEVA